MKYYVLILMITILLIFIIDVVLYEVWKPKTKSIVRPAMTYVPLDTIARLKPLWIKRIKFTEGLVNHVYKCPGGYNTIGYGHMVKRGEHFTLITNKQADSILNADYQFCIDNVPPIYNGNAKLAIARFIFGAGIGTFSRIKNELKYNPKVILKYCNINGKVNKTLLKERTLEYNLITNQ